MNAGSDEYKTESINEIMNKKYLINVTEKKEFLSLCLILSS